MILRATASSSATSACAVNSGSRTHLTMPEVGDKVPDFKLKNADGDVVTPETIAGKRSIFCFYPFAFSGVCTDQFSLYQEVIDEFKKHNADLYAISVDGFRSQKAFAESLGLTDIEMLTDFEPKGEAAKAFGIYLENGLGFSNRAVFIVEPDGTIGWAKVMPSLGEFPPPNELFDA